MRFKSAVCAAYLDIHRRCRRDPPATTRAARAPPTRAQLLSPRPFRCCALPSTTKVGGGLKGSLAKCDRVGLLLSGKRCLLAAETQLLSFCPLLNPSVCVFAVMMMPMLSQMPRITSDCARRSAKELHRSGLFAVLPCKTRCSTPEGWRAPCCRREGVRALPAADSSMHTSAAGSAHKQPQQFSLWTTVHLPPPAHHLPCRPSSHLCPRQPTARLAGPAPLPSWAPVAATTGSQASLAPACEGGHCNGAGQVLACSR